MDAGQELQNLARELPDGAFWIRGDWLKKLLTALIADRARASTGLTETPTANGRFLAAAGASAAAVPIPWALVKVSDTQIRVRRGSVYDVTTGDTFTPTGFEPGDDPTFVLTVSGDGVAWFSVTVDDDTGEMTAISNPASGASVPSSTSTVFYRELGSFSTTDGKLTVQSNNLGDQVFELCGGVNGIFSPGS